MRQQLLVPILALVAAAALVATLLFRNGSAPHLLPDASNDAAAATGDAAPRPAVADDADQPADDSAPGADDADAAADGRTEFADGPTVDPGTGPVVVVVHGDVPAAFVEVAWLLADRVAVLRSSLGRTLASLQDVDLPLRYGQRARTNADGQLQLPPLEGLTLLAVRDGDNFAATAVKPAQRRVRLQLERDETLQVAVVDGKGIGKTAVPVAIYRRAGKDLDALWRGDTDAHGRAVLAHFQLVRPKQTKGERFAAAAIVPIPATAGDAFTEFEGRPAPDEPVKIVLPTTVPLALALHHRSGPPILAPLDFALDRAPDASRTGKAEVRVVPDQFDRLRGRKQPGAVPIEFAHVGTGIRLLPRIAVEGIKGRLVLGEVAVPMDATERVDARVVLPDTCSVIAMRLVDTVGNAIVLPIAVFDAPAQQPVAFVLRNERGVVVTGQLHPVAEGACDLVFAVPGGAGALQMVLRDVQQDGSVRGCIVPVGELPAGERRDLGTLRLEPQPLLARGTVRDDRGQPIERAQVRLELRYVTERGERWRGEPMLEATTDADGAFAIFGALPPGPFRARAEAKNHFPEATDLLTPGAVLDLRLLRQGILKGRVLLPEWLPENAASVVLQSPEQDGRTFGTQIRRERGWFWLAGIQPGTYKASVVVRNLPEPLAVFDAVQIAPGENEDARLSPLDVSTSLFRYRLRAIGPRGPIGDLEGPILWRRKKPSGEANVVGFRWQKGQAELIAPVSFLEITTLGKGYLPTTVSLGAGDHDVYLQPVQPFVVALPGVRGAVGNRAVRVSAIHTKDSDLPQGLSGRDQRSGDQFSFPRWELGKSGGGWLDAFDRAEIVVSRGGPHELVLRVYEGEKQEGRQASVALGTHEIVIDGSQAGALMLQVDMPKLEEALRALQPREQTQGR